MSSLVSEWAVRSHAIFTYPFQEVRFMRMFRFLIFLNLVFFAGVSTGWAASSASIQGKVVDTTGAVIPNAAVSLVVS